MSEINIEGSLAAFAIAATAIAVLGLLLQLAESLPRQLLRRS